MKFRIGQPVRITSSAYKGDAGTIVEYDAGDFFPYGVRFQLLGGGTDVVFFMTSELELVTNGASKESQYFLSQVRRLPNESGLRHKVVSGVCRQIAAKLIGGNY